MFRSMTSNLMAAGLSTAIAAPAFATAGHSDVEFQYNLAGDKIEVEFGPEGRVFEGDFPEADNPTEFLLEQFTDDPGFDTEELPNGVNIGDTIGFDVVGPLLYHNGTGFVPVTAGVFIEVTNGANQSFSVTPSTSSLNVPIAQAAGTTRGDIHTHVDFELKPNNGDDSNDPPLGAYGFLAELTSSDTGVENSDSFYFVFNFGLEEGEGNAFETAVEAFAAQAVPEPTSAILLGLGGLALLKRRSNRPA